jgi:hypothetical protein
MNSRIVPVADRETAASAYVLAIGRKAKERLWQSGYLTLRDVTCTAIDGVVPSASPPSLLLPQAARPGACGRLGRRSPRRQPDRSLRAGGRTRRSREILANQSV